MLKHIHLKRHEYSRLYKNRKTVLIFAYNKVKQTVNKGVIWLKTFIFQN